MGKEHSWHWIVASVGVVLIAGCATTPQFHYSGSVLDNLNLKHRQQFGSAIGFNARAQQLVRLSDAQALTGAQTAIAQEDMTKAYNDALAKCSGILAKYEKSADNARWWLFGVSMVGATAGGIVVPTLVARATVAKSVVAGWSGVSGLTNLAQQNFVNEALDPNSYVTTRGAIVTKMQQYIAAYADAKGDYDKQYAAVASLEGACVAYDLAKASQQVNTFTPPSTSPSAPLNVAATAGTGSAKVTFEVPQRDGGSPITGYVATATADGNSATQEGASSPITITGLSADKTYTISVSAKNAVGSGPPAFAPTPVKPN